MTTPSIFIQDPPRPLSAPLAFRMSEIVSPLSLALDMSAGQPIGHSVRSCVLGMGLAKEIGLPESALGDLYYSLLMKDAGSSRCAPAPGRTQGGEFLQYGLPPVSSGFLDRVEALAAAPVSLANQERAAIRTRAAAGAFVAAKMGLPEAAEYAIARQAERWNGTGGPDGLRGHEIPLLFRLISLAQT